MNDLHRSDSKPVSLARTTCARTGACAGPQVELKEYRQFLAMVTICAFVLWGAVGCSTNAAKSGTQTPVIAVAMGQLPPTTMGAGTATQVSATVTNDVANAGVDWVATCGSAPNCGTFSPSHTDSGQNTTFTAPAGVPTGNTVTITALSTTDRSKAAYSPVNVTSTVTGVTISPALPSTAAAGSIVNLGATVIGDPANLGVDWKATCNTPFGPVSCGSGLHSAAGGTVQFAIPQTVPVPGTNQIASLIGSTVKVTGFATADHNFSAYATVIIGPAITISISQAPPATLLTNATAPVNAVISNDPSNSGVTWAATCESAPCGTITPTQTASGVAALYTAPPIVPSPNPSPGLKVTITAYATATQTGVQASVTVYIIAPLSVKITQGVTNNTIVLNGNAPLTATVNNDNANAGVDWSVTCGSPGACGSFVPIHTSSGASTTYTAPAAVPAGGTVTIVATSTTDPTASDQEIVNVTNAPPPNSLLLGQSVISLSARNSQNGPYILGGAIVGDGTGNITEGAVDLADAAGNAASSTLVSIVSPSTYAIGVDGRGQITLTINTSGLNTNFGVTGAAPGTGTLTLSILFVSAKHALLTEVDTFGNATGTLDVQNAADLAAFQSGSAGLNGTYSLQLSGTEFTTPSLGDFVDSAVTMQSSGTSYTVTGYTTDQSTAGAVTTVPFTPSSQTFSSSLPNLYGSMAFYNVNLGLPTKFSIDLWLIDANHFVAIDWRDAILGTPAVLISGYFTAQPASPSLSGTYAFTTAGATTAAQPQAVGGIITCGSTGVVDVVPLVGTGLSNQAVSASCTSPVNGRGLISISGAGSSGVSQFAAYPTVDSGIALIELDGGSSGTAGPSGSGLAKQQTLSTPISGSSLNGTYASVFATSTALGSENLIPTVVADGASTLSGTADVNSYNSNSAPPSATPSKGASLAGSFTPSNNGRFLLTWTLTPSSGQPAPQISVLHPACYLVDASSCLLLGLDTSAPGTGVMQLQNTGL